MLPEWHLLPQVAQAAFNLWGSSRGGPASIFLFHSVPALLHLESPLPLGALDVSGKLCVSSSRISSSSSVQVSGRACQRSTWLFDSGGTMLDGGSLTLHSSQHLGRHSSAVPHHKRSHHGCFSRPGAQGSAISAFNSLAAQQCVLHI